MKKVLVTGANGQLGKSLKLIAEKSNFEFVFFDRIELDITSRINISTKLTKDFNFCINCAAYTAVDKAEENQDKANRINHLGVRYLAEVCLEKNITLVHISTDFVFNGNSQSPYKEVDTTDPISVYGQTKLDGEKAIQNILSNYFIIRTSWLYSQFGHNFVKSMLHLSKNRDELSIVDNQIGTPTYALDLAQVLCKLMNDNSHFGLYHYSNLGDVSWYDFAKAIFERTENRIKVYPIPSSSYPTPATRPNYSVLDKGKIAKTLNLKIPYWQESLDKCLKGLF